MDKFGRLFIVATPIGNLGDTTLRAIETFRNLNLWFAEDTRELKKLMNCLEIPLQGKEVFSFAKHNLQEATKRALHLLQGGKDVGLATDRGTPCISDPGYQLVAEARSQGIKVTPIPGPSAVATSLSASGFPSDRFLFLGFLPTERKERMALLEKVQQTDLTTVFFESPNRIRETVSLLAELFPFGQILLAREMTKLYEEFSLLDLAKINEKELSNKGEYTIVILPKVEKREPQQLEEELKLRFASDKDWAKAMGERYQIPSREIYQLIQKQKTSR